MSHRRFRYVESLLRSEQLVEGGRVRPLGKRFERVARAEQARRDSARL